MNHSLIHEVIIHSYALMKTTRMDKMEEGYDSSWIYKMIVIYIESQFQYVEIFSWQEPLNMKR